MNEHITKVKQLSDDLLSLVISGVPKRSIEIPLVQKIIGLAQEIKSSALELEAEQERIERVEAAEQFENELVEELPFVSVDERTKELIS